MGREYPPRLPATRISALSGHMNDNPEPAKTDPRKERLAKALRDNLKRRKAQARQRADTGTDEGVGKASAPKS